MSARPSGVEHCGGATGWSSDALTVAVLAGGPSAEHEVSIASARGVCDGLLAAGHRVLWVEIDREGRWSHQGSRMSVSPGGGLLAADVVFPVLHGRFGEDGTVQGLLETLGVPYVGAGVSASALCMNKVLFKDLMSVAGVPQVGYVGVQQSVWQAERAQVLARIERLGLPLFVKPVHLGSSVGIVKVTRSEQIATVVEEAFAQDALVIVEAMAAGIEVECAVLGGGAHESDLAGGPVASVPGEITYEGDWYDYAAKYTPGAMELVIPARISVQARARVRGLATQVFLRCGCEGLARVDFFVAGEQVLVNELNTMPGFTPTSVYAKLMESDGVVYAELVDRLCRLALERHRGAHAHGR